MQSSSNNSNTSKSLLIPRSNNSSYLLSVDPSLRSTGWVLFSIETQAPVIAGLIKPTNTQLALASRLNQFQNTVSELLEYLKLNSKDYLVCEGPAPLVLNPQSALKVEHVRGMFETIARARNVCVPGRLNPRSVQSEILGLRGAQINRKQVKAVAKKTCEQLFPNLNLELVGIKIRKNELPQDIIDALLIGMLACSRIRQAIFSGIEPEASFAERRQNSRSKSAWQGWSEKDLISRAAASAETIRKVR
ncbi:crossover junction endodeoxyribonuclease RuvC [bacterium]|nr:crossover junction endodeoxyribonuclease RuvC [bacterium]